MNLRELQEKVNEWAAYNVDEYAKTESMKYNHPSEDVEIEHIEFQGIDDNATELFGSEVITGMTKAGLTEFSGKQLCERLGIPGGWSYGDNCPEELRGINLNWKLDHIQKELLIRERRDDSGITVRSVLSDQYGIINHAEFVDQIIEAVSFMGESNLDHLKVTRDFIGDEFRAYLYLPNLVLDLERGIPQRGGGDGEGGGGVSPALWLSNSEVGTGKCRVQPAVYRMVCQNGAMGWVKGEGIEIIHRGKKGLRTIAIAELAEKIAGVLKFSKKMTEAFVAKYAVKIKVTSIEDLLDKWSDDFGISDKNRETWKKKSVKVGATAFDIINDATVIAQHQTSINVTDEFERMAGKLIMAEIPAEYIQS